MFAEKIKQWCMGSLPHIFILLFQYIYILISLFLLSLLLSLFISFISSISLSFLPFSLSCIDPKKKGSQSLLQIEEYWGPIYTVKYFGRWIYFPDSWSGCLPCTWIWCQLVFCPFFLISKVEVPKAGQESVGTISAEDFLRLGTSGGRSSGRRLVF